MTGDGYKAVEAPGPQALHVRMAVTDLGLKRRERGSLDTVGGVCSHSLNRALKNMMQKYVSRRAGSLYGRGDQVRPLHNDYCAGIVIKGRFWVPPLSPNVKKNMMAVRVLFANQSPSSIQNQ
jgi:hypothetical protein